MQGDHLREKPSENLEKKGKKKDDSKARSISKKYGDVKHSILHNLLFSMLAFGLVVGLIFPFFAWFVLKTEAALSFFFFVMCVFAGLVVGTFNFFIFRIIKAESIKWGSSNLSVTMSIGTATYPVVRSSVCEELITFADKALYAAKEGDRNRVVVNDGQRMIPFAELEIVEQAKEKKSKK